MVGKGAGKGTGGSSGSFGNLVIQGSLVCLSLGDNKGGNKGDGRGLVSGGSNLSLAGFRCTFNFGFLTGFWLGLGCDCVSNISLISDTEQVFLFSPRTGLFRLGFGLRCIGVATSACLQPAWSGLDLVWDLGRLGRFGFSKFERFVIFWLQSGWLGFGLVWDLVGKGCRVGMFWFGKFERFVTFLPLGGL